jgi:hypothetical protein
VLGFFWQLIQRLEPFSLLLEVQVAEQERPKMLAGLQALDPSVHRPFFTAIDFIDVGKGRTD